MTLSHVQPDQNRIHASGPSGPARSRGRLRRLAIAAEAASTPYRVDSPPNAEKDRTTIEETLRRLIALVASLDEEETRATRERLSEDELALFDLLRKDGLSKADRERVKQASRDLVASIKAQLALLDRFWEKEQTKAEVETSILDRIFVALPTPPFTSEEKRSLAAGVFGHVWQQAMHGGFAMAA